MHRQLLTRLIFSFALVAACASFCVAGPAEDQFGVAAGHYARGRWQLAVDEMRRFLEDFPNHPQAAEGKFYLGEALMQLNKVAEARVQFEAFAAAAPQHRFAPQTTYRRGECAYLAGDYDAARKFLEEFNTQHGDNPLNAYALPYLGDLALMKSDGARAQGYYAKALRQHGETALADQCRFGLARALQLQHKYDDAARFYQSLIAKEGSPLIDDSLLGLGRLQYQRELYDEALKTLGKLVSEHPDSESIPFAHYWTGVTQLEKGEDFAAAVAALQRAAASAGNEHSLMPAIQFQLGEAFRRSGQLEEAAAHYQTVLDRSANSAWADDAEHGLIRLASDTNQFEAASKRATAFLSDHAESPLAYDVRRHLGRAQLKQLKYDEAIATLSKLVAALDEMSSASAGQSATLGRADARKLAGSSRFTLGLAYVGAEKYAEADAAIAALTPNEETEPDLAAGVNAVRAAAMMGQQKYTEAIGPLRNYLRLDPNGPDANQSRAQLAIALAHTNQLTEAQRVYDELTKTYTNRNEFLSTTHFLADAAFRADEKAWARELFTALADENNPPEFREKGLSGKAWCELDLESPVRSAETFDRLLKEFPESPLLSQAALARAGALQKAGDPDGAMAMYTLIINKHPDSKELPLALYQAGKLAATLKQGQQAETLLRRYVAEFPRQSNVDAALYRLAWVLMDEKREEEGRELFAKLHQEHPKSRYWADATFRLAQGAALSGDYPAVSQLVDDMVASETQDEVLSHALYLKGQAAAKLGYWDQVTPALEQLLARFPKSPLRNSAAYWIAESLYRQNEFDKAGEQFASLAQKTQGQSETWMAAIPMRRAQVLAHERKWAAAYAMAEPIAEQFPGYSQQYEVDYLLGRCLANQARFQDARDAYERVTNSVHGRRTETAAKAQWNIGETYFHQKKYDDAIRAYSRVELLYDFPRWQAFSLLQAGKCYEQLGQWSEAASRYDQILNDFADTEATAEATQRLNVAREKAKVVGGNAPAAPAGAAPLDARNPAQAESR